MNDNLLRVVHAFSASPSIRLRYQIPAAEGPRFQKRDQAFHPRRSAGIRSRRPPLWLEMPHDDSMDRVSAVVRIARDATNAIVLM
ncbi:hypothetical protein Nham_2036 [Nitrobacter hamburgensis X14]|uniref:Uncharacterized protein n=1 Tax=Nitrobacter hamburgensis (strain DSM 10229 / NCIMB 13809 / X14) TaxID=323097 RepID=Q1QLR3_NITHX|nr:hypothetical protein [Nitrobacter hamburgensis]ABE62834.1 hypothetical protein Nham_2036 [Nitrobacter hamburgensis X14]